MPQEIDSWPNTEVLERRASLYKGPLLAQRCLAQDRFTSAEYDAVIVCVSEYRKRLGGMMYMEALMPWVHGRPGTVKCLNEPKPMQRMDVLGTTIKHIPVFYPSGRLYRRSEIFQMFLWEAHFEP